MQYCHVYREHHVEGASRYTRSYTAYTLHSTATDRRWAMTHLNTFPIKKLAPLTTRSCSLRCVSAAEHYTEEQCSKTGSTKPREHLPNSDLSWNTGQDFLKPPSLWEAALETKRRCFSKTILESNVTPNITRSSDSFSTVPPIVNGGDWGCINCAWPGNYHNLGLTRNQFHSQKVTPLTRLTLPRSSMRDSATVYNSTAWGWHMQKSSKWSH